MRSLGRKIEKCRRDCAIGGKHGAQVTQNDTGQREKCGIYGKDEKWTENWLKWGIFKLFYKPLRKFFQKRPNFMEKRHKAMRKIGEN